MAGPVAVTSRKPPDMDRREAWQEVARRLDARLDEGKRESQHRVVLEHGPWPVTLDTYTVHTGQVTITYTRVQAFFLARGEMRFVIRRRNFFDALLSKLGFGGTVPAHRTLAGLWVVKGRPEARIRSLLSPELTESLLGQDKLRLDVRKAPRKRRKDMGAQACVVTALTTGVITDPDHLVGMFRVVTRALDALDRAGLVRREGGR